TTLNYTTDGAYSKGAGIGEPITITDNLGKVSHLRYDGRGNTISAIDALGNEADITYNLADQPLQTTYPATAQTGAGHSTTLNTYLYAGGPVTQMSAYDETGNLFRQVSPVYGPEGEPLSATGNVLSVTTAYDPIYRVKSITDGNSHQTLYSYNSAGYPSTI